VIAPLGFVGTSPVAARRNLTRLRRRANQADVLFISFPKSGRTWFRTMWAAYWCKVAGKEFDLRIESGVPGMPRMYATHDRWTHLLEANAFKRLLGHGLIPPGAARDKPKALLVRDPRDVVVSLFFHMKKRGQVKRRWKPDTLQDLVRNPDFGFATICGLMNSWYQEWGASDRFRLWRYEDARAEPVRVLREWLRFYGVQQVDEQALAHAVAFSDFNATRQREAAGAAKDKLISARDVADGDSFKARRGKVGGFTDYLDADDIAFCETVMRSLDPVFGYRV
jgi:hypothetical protein